MKKTKISFIIPSLAAGGAEKIMTFVAQNLNRKYFSVNLVVINHANATVYDTSNLNVIYLNKSRVLFSIFPLIKYFVKNKPDIVVSSISHLNSVIGLIAFFFPKIKFVGREASVMSIMNSFSSANKKTLVSIYKYSRIIGYKFLDAIICQSSDMMNDMEKNFGVPRRKLALINNPITDNFQVKTKLANPPKTIQIITVGRLSKEKGYGRIIDSIAKLDFNFKYLIIGDGPEKESIFNKINYLKLNDKVQHISFTNEVSKYLSQSSLFLQGSHVEGFPNALLESCSVGTPVVAFNAPGGTKEIIVDDENGYLVNTTAEFVDKIKLAINKNWVPKKISNTVTSKFNKFKIIKEYETLFQELVNNNRKNI